MKGTQSTAGPSGPTMFSLTNESLRCFLVELVDEPPRGSGTIREFEPGNKTENHTKPEQPENKPVAPQAQEPCHNTAWELAGGEGFEPPTAGSGGLCPILTRLPAHNIKGANFMYKRGS